ncbi:MAG: MFS transporter [Candidatus Eisenbacteria bacterium]|uniref:MFS transporter n=1 Tax=Eiseniibacteriota bacterium TaxID=2212470 RepID=A0A538TGU7_UNCEI|nr:MAG: MFS transporter [Candidatus Eisenbacteria bacterium]
MFRWIDTIFPRRALFQRDRRLLHLFLGRILASVGFSIVIPFLSLYLHGTRGVPMSAVGGVFFIAALAGAVGQIVGGELSDRRGRKFVLVSSQLIRVVAFFGFGLAVIARAPFVVFALLTSVSAFAGRMFEPPSGAMIADIADGHRRAEYYGVLRIGGNLGWALGPALGGFLAALSYSSLFLIAACVLLAGAVVMALKVEETSPRHRARTSEATPVSAPVPEVGPPTTLGKYRFQDVVETLRDKVFLRYCLVSLVLFTVTSQLISTLSVYAVEWAGLSKVDLGFLYALNGLMVVFLQFPAVRLTASMRLTSALALGAVLYGIGYGMMGLGGGLAFLSAAMFVTTLGEIVATPPSLNLVANFSGEATRGRYMGIFGLFNSFGWSMGPLVGGVLLDLTRGRPMVLWGTITGIAFLAAAGFLDVRRRIDTATDRNVEAAGTRAAMA